MSADQEVIAGAREQQLHLLEQTTSLGDSMAAFEASGRDNRWRKLKRFGGMKSAAKAEKIGKKYSAENNDKDASSMSPSDGFRSDSDGDDPPRRGDKSRGASRAPRNGSENPSSRPSSPLARDLPQLPDKYSKLQEEVYMMRIRTLYQMVDTLKVVSGGRTRTQRVVWLTNKQGLFTAGTMRRLLQAMQ